MSISTPLPTDILCGKDKTYSKHPGNKLYRRMIEDRATSYAIEASKQIKMGVTKEIVACLQNSGARFLRKTHTCEWEEISDQQARDKTSHALRFCAKYHTKKRPVSRLLPARLTRTRSAQHRRTVSTDTVEQHHDSVAVYHRQQAILHQSLSKENSEPTPDGVVSSNSYYDMLQEPLHDSMSGGDWDGFFIQPSSS